MRIILACLLLSGCAALSTQAGFTKAVAAGYQTVAAIAQTTDTLLNAGKISSATAQNIESQDLKLENALGAAQQAYAANAASGADALTTAINALNALNAYLATL